MNRLYADGKCIGDFPEDEDYDPPAWKNTNCRNCGAPLKGGKCEYCGTQVEPPRRVLVPEPETHSYITIDAEKIQIGFVNMGGKYRKIAINQS